MYLEVAHPAFLTTLVIIDYCLEQIIYVHEIKTAKKNNSKEEKKRVCVSNTTTIYIRNISIVILKRRLDLNKIR